MPLLACRLVLQKTVNSSSPQSLPLQDQAPNQKRIGIEFTSDPDMPEPELSPSPVYEDTGSGNSGTLLPP